jgi:hypothetical protein
LLALRDWRNMHVAESLRDSFRGSESRGHV